MADDGDDNPVVCMLDSFAPSPPPVGRADKSPSPSADPDDDDDADEDDDCENVVVPTIQSDNPNDLSDPEEYDGGLEIDIGTGREPPIVINLNPAKMDPTRKLQRVEQFDNEVPRSRLRSRTAASVRNRKALTRTQRTPVVPAASQTPPAAPPYENGSAEPQTPLYGDETGVNLSHIRTSVVNHVSSALPDMTGKSVPDKIASLLWYKVSIPLVLLLLVWYLWQYAPVQPVSESYARLIVQGCSYDPNTKILCTIEGCFREPFLYEKGPNRAGGFETRPEYVVVRHTVWWFSEAFATLKSERAVGCVVKLFAPSTG